MKRFLAVLLGFILIFTLAACREDTGNNTPSDGDNGGNGGLKENGKALVVYFSASGNTERVAGYIAEATGGTLFELVPVTPYTSADLSYTMVGSRVNREHEDESLRDIALETTTPDNFDDYDVVFVGYPIWWSVAAWPVNNFVKNNDFGGKTVIPFATSASSGLGSSGTNLRDMAGTGNWLGGQRFSSSASKSDVEKWIDGLGFKG